MYIDRLKDDRDWNGLLCVENFDLVVARLRRMIGDSQPYTFVTTHEGYGWRPEARTSQKAEAIKASRESRESGEWAHVFVSDTYGSWGLHTTAQTEKDAREQDAKSSTELTFERGQLMVKHYNGYGDRMYWLIAPEGGEA